MNWSRVHIYKECEFLEKTVVKDLTITVIGLATIETTKGKDTQNLAASKKHIDEIRFISYEELFKNRYDTKLDTVCF